MNRKQRRLLTKRINKLNDSSQKEGIFRILLTTKDIATYSSLKEINPVIEANIDKFLMPSSIKAMAIVKQTINCELDFSQSILLALLLFQNYKDVLSKYVMHRENYEKCLFFNKNEEAKGIIYTIIKECGWSLWACGQLLVLEENMCGLEGNKGLLGSFLEEGSQNRLICSLLEFMSYRAENSTSLKNYNEKVDKYLRFYEDEATLAYFSYKLKIGDISFDELLRYVLQIDMQLSIIDLYNSFLDIIQRATIERFEVDEKVIVTIATLNKQVNDFLLRNLLIFYGNNEVISMDETVLVAIEAYTVGDYEKALTKLKKYLSENPSDYQMWIMYIKCNIYLGINLKSEIDLVKDIFSVYSLDEYCMISHVRLLGYLKKYRDTTWRYKLLNTAKRKLSFDRNLEKYISLSLLGEYTVSPRFISMIPNNCKGAEQLRLFQNIAPNCYSLLTQYKLVNNIDITSFRSDFFYADSLMRQDKLKEATDLLKRIYNDCVTSSLYVKEKVVRRLFFALCTENRIKEAITIVINAFFENENLIRRCNLMLALEKIKSLRNREIYKLIEYPIYVYITNRFGFKEQRIAFSNFMDSNDIKTKEEFYDFVITKSQKNIFFMEKICTLDVIKRHVRIVKNSSIATAMRIELLQQLILLNPSKKKEYLEEISSITTRKEINNRVRQVTQHKIKVDVEKIKEEKSELFEENFQKYLQIKSFNRNITGFDINDSTNINSLRQIVDSMNEEIKRNAQYSQTILTLKDFITDIQYEFLRNEKYGLDNYLSSRIRHGYCKAQLTKDLREHHLLLSTADDDSECYDISQYWDARVRNQNGVDYQAVKEALAKFTLDIENKIKEIRRDWIRIRINRQEVGMFDYTTFAGSMLVVDRDNIVDYDVMFNNIVESLWDFTERNLSTIRSRIQKELKSFFYEKLNSLEKRIKSLDSFNVQDICTDILNSITICRVKMQTVLTEFENFFYRDDVVYEDFTLENLATTCEEIEKQIHAEFDKINLTVNIDGKKRIKGNCFSDFVEIVVMLMNNAISHAGFQNMKSIDLTLDFSVGTNQALFGNVIDVMSKTNPQFSTGDLLVLSVQNNLSADKDIHMIRERVQYIFDNAKDPATLKKYSITEGGSGIYKIYKTINYNVSVPYVILYTVEKNVFILFLAVDASTLFA